METCDGGHVKGQAKEGDSMKETRGRRAAETDTDTNTGDLPERQSKSRVRHCRQICVRPIGLKYN